MEGETLQGDSRNRTRSGSDRRVKGNVGLPVTTFNVTKKLHVLCNPQKKWVLREHSELG